MRSYRYHILCLIAVMGCLQVATAAEFNRTSSSTSASTYAWRTGEPEDSDSKSGTTGALSGAMVISYDEPDKPYSQTWSTGLATVTPTTLFYSGATTIGNTFSDSVYAGGTNSGGNWSPGTTQTFTVQSEASHTVTTGGTIYVSVEYELKTGSNHEDGYFYSEAKIGFYDFTFEWNGGNSVYITEEYLGFPVTNYTVYCNSAGKFVFNINRNHQVSNGNSLPIRSFSTGADIKNDLHIQKKVTLKVSMN